MTRRSPAFPLTAALLSAAAAVLSSPAAAFAPSVGGLSVRTAAAAFGGQATTTTTLAAKLDGGDDGTVGRREAVAQSLALIFAAASTSSALTLTAVLLPLPAYAKEKEPITPELVTAAFNGVRYQLESATDGIPQLETLISAADFPEVMEFTKLYDGAFRKGKMKPAKKCLTEKKATDEAQMLMNAVTFDLIGINKNARPGQESQEGMVKYLEELKGDVKKFLELEGTIVLLEGAQ